MILATTVVSVGNPPSSGTCQTDKKEKFDYPSFVDESIDSTDQFVLPICKWERDPKEHTT